MEPQKATRASALFAEQERDDLSTHSHRLLIGLMGLLLPLLLWSISGWRHANDESRWRLLDSVSAYYHTGAVAAFVGIISALSAFLITYRGYANEFNFRERVAGGIASIAAAGVAFFPTAVPEGYPAITWWTSPMRVIHYVCAVALFSSFAFFCLFMFPKSKSKDGERLPLEKRVRNRIYYSCGAIILICMAWAGLSRKSSIFVPESIALVAFAISWLVKGRADWTLAAALKRTFHLGRQP